MHRLQKRKLFKEIAKNKVDRSNGYYDYYYVPYCLPSVLTIP